MVTTSFEVASDAVRSRLGEAAANHSLRVAEAAATLAQRYGIDPAKARLAGLLHDWDREVPPGELVTRAREAGVEMTDADTAVPHLLHARTAAAVLPAALPGIPPDVLCAIERHTVGAAEMSDLDMIVYVADMIEPGREYPEIPALREAAGTVALPVLFALCYQHTLAYLVATRQRIHPDTVSVWNTLVAVDAP